MPELPEVETIRRDLSASLPGARVAGLWTSGKPLRLNRPLPARALAQASVGGRVEGLRRRAKYLLVDLVGPAGASVVVVHLGMSGRLRLSTVDEPRPAHTHVVWTLDGGRELRFIDVRRFGSISVARRGEEDRLPELRVLGDDPFELTAARLHELARRTRRALKVFLLDQRHVAGLGNIYVSEALFEAGIHPAARADRLSRERAAALRDAIVQVLERGLANRGTTLRDYVDAGGAKGQNQHALRVYGRVGEPCPRGDGGRIRRVTSQARSTYFCPTCQRR